MEQLIRVEEGAKYPNGGRKVNVQDAVERISGISYYFFSSLNKCTMSKRQHPVRQGETRSALLQNTVIF